MFYNVFYNVLLLFCLLWGVVLRLNSGLLSLRVFTFFFFFFPSVLECSRAVLTFYSLGPPKLDFEQPRLAGFQFPVVRESRPSEHSSVGDRLKVLERQRQPHH